ncbi:hypothetical protein F5I97DRAFT_1808452 [Phlebopus sp. FC_14]|nr:hypothetical protein F5I97DRAFT_1808452 [Phlebopus sp. FC_14]
MVFQFKLSKVDGLTRRATFAARPSWSLLSSRIGLLYDIARQNVGVSYVDPDGDEVTLSSEEELQDFYNTLTSGAEVIKFTVQDLGILRSTIRSPVPQNAQSHFRNTFGGHEGLPLMFEVDDEWQRLPGNMGNLFLSRDAPESPHAFVEVLESDLGVSKQGNADASHAGDATRSDLTFTKPGPSEVKGKGRAATMKDDVSSTGSVIGNETPSKPPVHVYDMSDTEDIFGRTSEPVLRGETATPAQAQSTPLISEQNLMAGTSSPLKGAVHDDPPLPTVNFPDPSSHAPSLTHDVATLLTNISTVVSAHPELSEGIRNLASNATNGTYWAVHREAISRAAGNIQKTAIEETGRTLEQIRRTTEEEAGARVADALGRVFRAFSEIVQPIGAQTASPGVPSTPVERVHYEVPNARDLPPGLPIAPDMHRDHRRCAEEDWVNLLRCPSPGYHLCGARNVPPPAPPPPASRGWPRPPPPHWVDRSFSYDSDVAGPEPRREMKAAAAEILATAAEARSPAASAAEVRAHASQSQLAADPSMSSDLNSSPEQLRAEVEQAKADYKARKERYRKVKAIRKMAEQRARGQKPSRESVDIHEGLEGVNDAPIPVPEPIPTHAAESAPTPPMSRAPEVHIVSNARGRYPQLEMFSVPMRRHTMGHAPRSHGRGHDRHGSRENYAFNRIMRKLSDMGFTDSAYANLSGKVMDQLLVHPPTSKDAEDDIVTNMIEELIPSNGGLPHVSGPGGIPGAWH